MFIIYTFVLGGLEGLKNVIIIFSIKYFVIQIWLILQEKLIK